jgi:hypothetical protein
MRIHVVAGVTTLSISDACKQWSGEVPTMVLIWNDLSTRSNCFLPSSPLKEAVQVVVEVVSRRLIILIFAGRNRIIVICRELPRTIDAGSVRRPTA